MKRSDYIEAVNQPGAFQTFKVTGAVDEPAAAWRGKVTLTRNYTFRGRTGIDYAKLAVNSEHVVQPRTWGTRLDRYFVAHTPKKGPRAGQYTIYATVFAIEGSFRTQWFVNGEPVSQAEYNAYRTPGAAKPKPFPNGGYMDIALDTLEAVQGSQD